MSDKYYRGLRNTLNDVKNKLQLASMTLKINENKNNISSNLEQISTNTSSISTNLEKIDNFTQYILQSGKDFEEKYIIKKQVFRFNKDKHFYTIFEKEIEFEYTKNSLLFIKNNMYYKYDNLSNDYHRLQHEYNIYDDENNLIHKYLFNKDTYYDESLDPILHTNEDFCICFKKNYNKIKINLQLHRHNRHGVGNINLEINDDSYINIDYVDRNNEGNNEQVDTNTRDISTNLSKINTNVTDISSNLGKIDGNINAIKLINKNSQDNSNDISNNKGLISTNTSSISSNSGQISTNKSSIASNLSKINTNVEDISSNLSKINDIKNKFNKLYLKNIYNILVYNSEIQIDFKNWKNLFYEKVFNINAIVNDFIEMNFKIELEYGNITERSHIKTKYQILDENNNSLYIKSVNHENYSTYLRKVIVNDSIFYNFIRNVEKLKFLIEFRISVSSSIYIKYIKNDNNRLIIKHYGN